MLKKVSLFICFFALYSILLSSPTIASSRTLKKGFYKAGDLNLSPDTTYTIQNNSFSERIYILIFDSKATSLQGVRLKPQSPKFNLIPLQPDYKLVLIGEGELEISS